jgi:hypothetical protein
LTNFSEIAADEIVKLPVRVMRKGVYLRDLVKAVTE